MTSKELGLQGREGGGGGLVGMGEVGGRTGGKGGGLLGRGKGQVLGEGGRRS